MSARSGGYREVVARMTDTSAMMFAKKKWSEPDESPTKRAVVPEKYLQSFADQYLALQRIRSIRVPDKLFNWINGFAPSWVKKLFNKAFGGLSDNTCLIRIAESYSLALHLELKTEDTKGRRVGKLHGKQKPNARNQGWKIARNQNEIQAAIDKFIDDAEKLGELLSEYSIDDMVWMLSGE